MNIPHRDAEKQDGLPKAHQMPNDEPAAAVNGEKRQEVIETQQDVVPSNEQTKAEKKAARKYMWKLVLCLWLPFFLSSIDVTVVATALPFIASHFDAFNQLNWAVTAFTLTATAFIPIFGQLADTFGRHASLQAAVWMITVGSIICAAAPAWSVLLLGRALQGVGTAGVQNVVMIILTDKVSLGDQARNTSVFQLVGGIGYSVGPVIGGYLTNADTANRGWRYCFVLPAAVGIFSIGTLLILRKDLVPGRVSLAHPPEGSSRLIAFASGLKTLDIGGASLFIAGVALIILGTSWGGSTYAWSSATVIAPIVVGTILCIAFILYEHLLEPDRYLHTRLPGTVAMIPVKALRNKDVCIISVVAASTGAALYSVFYFIGIYFILAEGRPADDAGTQLLYYVPGLGVGAYGAIFLVKKWPRQTFPPLVFGTVLETAGLATLAYAVHRRDSILVKVMMAVSGIGTGIRFMPSNVHLTGMLEKQTAAAFSMPRFAQPFGGTLALTIMGAVFQNKMSRNFGALGTKEINLHDTAALDAIANLPADQQNAIRLAGANATMWAFVSILPFLGLSMLSSLGLRNVWIHKDSGKLDVTHVQPDETSTRKDVIDRGLYLLNVFRGRTSTGYRDNAFRDTVTESTSPTTLAKS